MTTHMTSKPAKGLGTFDIRGAVTISRPAKGLGTFDVTEQMGREI